MCVSSPTLPCIPTSTAPGDGMFLRLPSPSCTPGLGGPLAALAGGSDDLGIWVPTPSIGRPQQASGRGTVINFPFELCP